MGSLFYILVDMAGANQSTPSGEGDPTTNLVTEYQVEYDNRTTGYASCDLIPDSSTDFKCSCNHERQLNKSAPCVLNSVGVVDLKPYYERLKLLKRGRGREGAAAENGRTRTRRGQAEVQRVGTIGNRVGAAGHGCNWYDDDRCQINLGKKLSTGAEAFEWLSFPQCVENSKWRTLSTGKTVHAFCVIDTVAGLLTHPALDDDDDGRECRTHCKQPIPSGGRYNVCYLDCLFEDLLGPNWNTGTPPVGAGCPYCSAEQMAGAFRKAIERCPSVASEQHAA